MKKDFTLSVSDRKKLIVAALRKHESVTCARLQELCGDCSAKTIRRTIDKLRDDRWPIESSNEGYFLRKASSAEKECTHDTHFGVLMIAGCSIDKNIGKLLPGVGDHIKREILGLSEIEETEDALLIDRSVDMSQSIYSEAQIKTFGAIARNIVDELAISFEYRNVWEGAVETRAVYPIQLKLKDGMWYLLSWDLDRDDMRVFKLPKILDVRICEQKWSRPSIVAIDGVLNSAKFSIWDRGEDPIKITLKVEGHAKEHLEHHALTSHQELIQRDKETYAVMETSDIVGFLSWCRHFIHNVEIIEPASVKQKFIEELNVGLSKHSVS